MYNFIRCLVIIQDLCFNVPYSNSLSYVTQAFIFFSPVWPWSGLLHCIVSCIGNLRICKWVSASILLCSHWHKTITEEHCSCHRSSSLCFLCIAGDYCMYRSVDWLLSCNGLPSSFARGQSSLTSPLLSHIEFASFVLRKSAKAGVSILNALGNVWERESLKLPLLPFLCVYVCYVC